MSYGRTDQLIGGTGFVGEPARRIDDIEVVLPDGEHLDGTRGRILAAGLSLFAERGYHAASIREIGAAAGVQSASLYSHFRSKEAILTELVFIGHDALHQWLLTALLEAGTDPRDQLAALIRTHVGLHAEYALLATVTNREMTWLSPEAAAPAAALRLRSADLLLEVLDRGVTRDVFTIDEPLATANAISAMGVAVANWYPKAGGDLAPAALGELYADLALRMVGATDR